MAGLELDPWQEYILTSALGEDADGKWAAFEVGVVVPRQNGKGSVLEARELAGLFLLDERLLTHSAHQFDTSLEAFRRLLMLIESTPDFDRRVRRVSRSHGEEGIELLGGQRIRFRTRTKGGGRGFSGDLLVLDEAMILPESTMGALMPTLAARPNPQVWYAGSAVDQDIHEHGVVLARVRERGHRGDDPKLAYFEHSIEVARDPDDPAALERSDAELVAEQLAADERGWAQANPGLGIRITTEYIRAERRALAARTFAVERLGAGDWPPTDKAGARVITADAWDALVDEHSQAEDPVSLAFDVTPDRARSSIGVAGRRADGEFHVEVIDARRGTGWVAGRLAELDENHQVGEILYAGASTAASLVPDIDALDLDAELHPLTAKEEAQACGHFYDRVSEQGLRHLGSGELDAALAGACKRDLGDAWAWSRRSSGVDISPLVTITLALWGAAGQLDEKEPLVAWA